MGTAGSAPPWRSAPRSVWLKRAPDRDAPLVSIFLAGAPRGKGRPKVVLRPKKGGGMRPTAITPDATLDYEARLRSVAIAAMAGRPVLTGSLDVLLIATVGVTSSWPKGVQDDALAGRIRPGDMNLKPDFDNIAKMVDALKGIVWDDDTRVDDGSVRRLFGREAGLLIEVRRAEVVPGELSPATLRRLGRGFLLAA